jgi:hypothetical protein
VKRATVHALTIFGTRCGKGSDGTFLYGPRTHPDQMRVPLTCKDCRRLTRLDRARERRAQANGRKLRARIMAAVSRGQAPR